MARRRPQPEGPGRKGPPGSVARRRQPEIGLSPPRSWAPRAAWSGGPFRLGAVAGHSQKSLAPRLEAAPLAAARALAVQRGLDVHDHVGEPRPASAQAALDAMAERVRV